MVESGVGEWIWLASEQEVFVPAKIVSQDRLTVETEDGERHRLSSDDPLEAADEQCMNPAIENLIWLDDLNEKSILNVLRIRFKQDRIYTSVSSILVSVNPFKQLALYTPEVMERYRKGEESAPHVFALARDSFRAMLNDRRNQSVVISGESGSGKSESTKLILQFIAEVSERQDGTSSSCLERQILEANPILEAMGNAKTVRNNNSSRFGKLISVKFDTRGSIVGGSIVEYLLEKSRVTHQAKGERNYHLFYQILAADETIKSRLGLEAAEDYNFLNQSGVTGIQNRCEGNEFDATVRSMGTLKFSDEEREAVLVIIAAILHLSNLRFETDEDDGVGCCCVATASEASRAIASDLLGLEETALSVVLTSRMVGARSVVLVPYKVEEAIATRNAMCKAIYGGLFKWTVSKINASLDQGVAFSTVLSVLDIFGFESFENNSFEQLCINYSNEKLQYHFNNFIFRLEEEIYRAEGVAGSVATFDDNQPALDLLEKKATGIFAMLDEEVSVPRGSDAGFLSKIIKTHDKNHPNFLRPNAKNCPSKTLQKVAFGVSHFAGVVMYNSTQFLEKNKDRLHGDVVRLVTSSTNEFVSKSIFCCDEGRKKTLGSQFKKQLGELIATLNATDPHFVRCVKPNESKVGDVFDSEMVLKQMRYSGLLEVCRIRKLGFPTRRNFADFFNRYRCVDPTAHDLDMLLGELERRHVLKDGEWVKGKTKIFMRVAQSTALEVARDAALVVVVVKIEKIARRFMARSDYRVYKGIVDGVRAAIRSRKEQAITRALDQRGDLPFAGQHLSTIKEAQHLLVRIREENLVKIQQMARGCKARSDYRMFKVIVEGVEAAIGGSLDEKALVGALDRCAKLPYAGNHLVSVQEAKRLVVRIHEVQCVESRIASAICEAAEGNRRSLISAISAAESMQPPFVPANLENARELVAIYEEEERTKEHLSAAVSSRGTIEVLDTWLQKADELDIGDQDVVQQARILRERLLDKKYVIESLVLAIQSCTVETLSTVISNCESMGFDDIAELKQARALYCELLAAPQLDDKECSISDAEAASTEDANTVLGQQAVVEQCDQRVHFSECEPERFDGTPQVEGESSKPESTHVLCVRGRRQESKEAEDALAAARSESYEILDHECDQNSSVVRDEIASTETFSEVPEESVTTNVAVTIEASSGAGLAQNPDERPDFVLEDICELEHATSVSEASRVPNLEGETAGTDTVQLDDVPEGILSPSSEFAAPSTLESSEVVETDARPSMAAELEADEALLSLIGKALERRDNQALAACYEKASARGIGGNQMQRARAILKRDPAVCKRTFRHDIRGGSTDAGRRPDPQFRFQNYSGLRLPGSYARGFMMNKSKIKDGMLKWQSTPIPRSLLELDQAANRIACGIHKSILGYMRDRPMVFPATLAQDIVRKGTLLDQTVSTVIRDEIFLQIMKQLTLNPSQNSVAHGWHLMCICVSSFRPSAEFRMFLVNFLASHQSNKQTCCIRNYANYCMNTLEEDEESSALVPSIEDIQAYFKRPPSLATVSLVNGQVVVRNLSVSPDMNCERVCEICAHLLELKSDLRTNFGIYVYEGTSDQDRHMPRPLQSTDFIGDIVVQKAREKQDFSFVYKRKLFLASEEREDDDENLRRLEYLQAEDDVIKMGNVRVHDEAQVVELAAISLAVALGQEKFSKSQLVEMKNLLSYLPREWRKHFDAGSLSDKLIRVPLAVCMLEKRFIEIVSKQRLYGTHTFYCENMDYSEQPALLSALPNDLAVCINENGIILFEASTVGETALHSFSYEEVYRWAGTRSTFTFFIRDKASEPPFQLRLSTVHSQGIGAIISDYVRAVAHKRKTSLLSL